ncbi:MAG: type III-A CRISPR-associated RAMP protein Csm5 [Magnetococcus sp. YQC-3]
MAERFLDHHELLISTLSPVHVGCGQDYDPTSYIMEEEICYIFDPMDALQNDEDRQVLLNIVERIRTEKDIPHVQRFFYERRERLLPMFRRRLSTGPGIQTFYDEKINALGSTNRLQIERMTSLAAEDRLYVPGSSLKGAIRTALLDQEHGGRPLANPRDAEVKGRDWRKLAPLHSTLARALPDKDFSLDPMRLLRFSDLNPLPDGESGEVFFAVNRKGNGEAGRGPYQVLECLTPMSLESLRGWCSFLDPKQARREADKLPDDMLWWNRVELARRCNRFYRKQLQTELERLATVLSDDWARSVSASLANGGLRRLLESDRAFLVRIGRYSGAESVTLNGVRHIERPQKKDWVQYPGTVWLAASRDTRQEYDLLPFGWLLVEFDHPGRRPLAETVPELVVLARQFQSRGSERLQKSDARLQQLWEKRQREQAQAEEAARRREEEETAEQARREHLAAMSDQERAVTLFREEIAGTRIVQPIGGALWNRATLLVKEAASWTTEERQRLAQAIREELPGKLKGVPPKRIQELLERISA